MPIKGKIEVFSRRSVTGWLAVFGDHQEKPMLELLLDGMTVATAVADEPRPDVMATGFGDGLCQFRFVLPQALTDEEVERLKLHVAYSDVYLELPRPAGWQSRPASLTTSGPASPVFIVGSPRSGTSVLTRALTAIGYHGFEEGNLLGLSQMVDQHVDWYFQANDANSPETLLGNVNQSALKGRLFAVFKETLDHLNSVDPWFDKTGNPETILILPRVMEAWPSSRVIFAKRRGIENVMSRLAKFPGRDFAYHCDDWANNMRAWRTTRGQLDSARWLEVDQRELLDTPGVVAARLVGLLGLQDHQREIAGTIFQTERPQESFPGSSARRNLLSETGWAGEEIGMFQALCGEEMVAYGYRF